MLNLLLYLFFYLYAVDSVWSFFLLIVIFSVFFRHKRIIELGSGYGLAGLVIAAATEALEVVISDGNPQVVDCILLAFSG